MARLTLYAAAGSSDVAYIAQQELVVIFEAALAVLVADGASPTQAHVTTANNAYTNLKVVWTKDVVLDYDRANVDTLNEKLQAAAVLLASMKNVG